MKKIILISILISIGFNSDILYSESSPQSSPQKWNEKSLEDIENKISTIEEEISFLEKEISRDKDIVSWGQNQIALRMTRDLLNRDLSEKKRLLDKIKKMGKVGNKR